MNDHMPKTRNKPTYQEQSFLAETSGGKPEIPGTDTRRSKTGTQSSTGATGGRVGVDSETWWVSSADEY